MQVQRAFPAINFAPEGFQKIESAQICAAAAWCREDRNGGAPRRKQGCHPRFSDSRQCGVLGRPARSGAVTKYVVLSPHGACARCWPSNDEQSWWPIAW